MKRISPRSIGSPIALYEHKIFPQSILLQICSFDQWGVQLGKGLATKIQNELMTQNIFKDNGCSTSNLLKYYLLMSINSNNL